MTKQVNKTIQGHDYVRLRQKARPAPRPLIEIISFLDL